MKITIKFCPDGETQSYDLYLDPECTVDWLKQQIYLSTGIQPQDQILSYYFNSEKLIISEDKIVSEYNLQEDQYVFLTTVTIQSPARQNSSEGCLNRLGVMTPNKFAPESVGEKSTFEKILEFAIIGATAEFWELLSQEEPDEYEEPMHSRADVQGWTSFHYAAYSGHTAIIQKLVQMEADVNKEGKDDWTPLQLACSRANPKIVAIILHHPQIQIDRTTSRGTAMHVACKFNQLEIVRMLLNANAAITTSLIDASGKTALELTDDPEILMTIPVYMGERQMSKVFNPYLDLPPQPFQGLIMCIKSYNLEDQAAFLVLSIQKLALEIYDNKEGFCNREEPFYTWDLAPITSVKQIKKPGMAGFSISVENAIHTFYAQDAQIWQQFLFEAICYAQRNSTNPNLHQSSCIEDSPSAPSITVTDHSSPQSPEYPLSDQDSVNFKSFTIIDELGVGSFGTVYKVVKNDTQKVYACKVLNKQFMKKHKQLKYAISECRVMKDLNHPFVLKLDYAFQTPKNLFLVLEYCQNGDLLAHLHKKKKFSNRDAQFYFAETLLAMEYLHDNDIVYRDLKPENILIDAVGHIRLADFGLAKDNMQTWVNAISFCGTPAYLAPEIITNEGSHKHSDIYTLGVLLYEMLTGGSPFQKEKAEDLYKAITTDNIKFPSHVKVPARQLINSMLDRNTKNRPSIKQIKASTFLQNIDWEQLAAKQVKPPRLGKGWKQVDNDNDTEVTLEKYPSVSERPVFYDADYATEEQYEESKVEGYVYSRNN